MFYYLILMNESYVYLVMFVGVEEGICKGIYKLEMYVGNKVKV